MVDFSLSGLGVAEDELDKFSITERTPTPQTVPPPEDFSSTALGGEFDAPQSVAAGFLANAPVSSDAYAKARNLAKKLNLPVILGEREPQRLRSEDIVSQAQKLLERHPGLSAFLRDPDNQKLVGDDLDTLSRISVLMTALETREEAVGAKEFLGEFPEYIAKSFGSLGASAKQFYIQSGIANAMVGAMAAKTNMDLAMTRSVFAALGADEVAAAIPALDPARFAVDPKGPEAKAAAEYGKKYRDELQYIFQRATGGDYWSEIALGGTTSLVMMGAAIAAGSITGGSTLGIMGSMAFVNRFGEAMDRGFSVGAASAEAVFFATLEVVSERIPLKLILGNKAKGLESLKGQIPGLLKAMGAESLQEVFIDAVDKGYDKLVLDKTTTWPEVFRSLSQAGIIGAGVGGTLRGGMMGLNKVASVIMPDPGAGAYEQALMAIKAEVDGAKTQTRDPAVMKAALEGMADGAEVFISANELLELEQNEELTFAQLEEAGLSTDTIEAMQLGGDVKLSVSELLALRPEIFALLSPSVRRTINSDTVREADQKLQERDQTIDRLLADMQAQLDEDASARPIHSTVSEQLRSTGKYNDAQVDRMADLVAESYETRAANTTKTAEELFLDDHVSIRTGRATPDGARGQATALTQEGGFEAYRNIVDPEGRTIPAEDRPNLRMGDMYGMLPKDAEVVGELDDVTLHRGANGDYYATAYNADLGEQDVVGFIQGRENGTELAVVEEMQGKGIGSELQYLFRRENPLAPTGGLTEAGASRLESTYDRLAAEYMDPLEQSAAELQEQPLTIAGTGPGGRVLNRDIGRAFTDRHMAAYGRALDPSDPADYAIILDSLLADYAEQSRQPDSGDSWYTDDIAEAVRLTEYIYPELANPQFRDLFLTATALLSPQQKPGPNWENAILALRSWKETGRIDLSKPSGAKFGVNTKGLQLLQHLIDTKGLEGAMRWVQEEHTGTEMAEIRRDSGLFVEKPRLGQYTPNELNLNSVTLGIYMFGPKVGDFMQNSVGIDQNAVTVDLWAARSYNRYIGRLLDTPDGDLVGDVRGAKERNQIKRLIRDAAEQAGIDPSAMQAALWYFEQRLYRSHGVRAVSQNFSGAAETALKSRGLEDAFRTPVSYQQDAVGDAGKSPSASPARPVATEGGGPGRDVRAGAVGRGELGAGQEGVPAAPLQPLPGAPKLNGEQFGPIPELVSAAESYAEKAGIPYTRQPVYVPVTPSRSERIAQAYEAAEHEPKNPDVRRAYRALITQTKAQYDALIEAGYTFTFFDDTADPYDGNPWNAMRDLRDNKTMAVYSTLAGYGTDQTFDPSEHMLLEDTGLTWKDQNGNDVKVLANDLFRAVHDAFGHGLEGAGFRARGEENAWQAHARLFTGEAVKALTTETRGQNSWLNYGPYGEQNRTAGLEDTVFANQKMTILPSWVSSEGAGGRYGLPVNEDGTVTLTHFSETEGLTQLDPSRHGTGMAGDEGARKNIEGWVDRTYFGVSVGKEGGYVSEFPADTPSYEARVPADSIYDYQQDPDGLMATVKDQAITQRRANGDHLYDFGKLHTLYEKAIADAGYEGYFNNARQGLTVAKFTQTEVTSAEAPVLEQQRGATAGPRGSFQQERDTYGNLENIISLLDGADLTTFLHEGGHFWLFQMQRDLNSDYLTEQGRARLQKQWDNTTAWFQQNSKQAWSDIQKMAKSARRRATANPDDAVMQDRAARLEAAVSRAKRGNGDIYMAEVAANFMNGSVENGTDLEVAFHELWARGAEKYLGEGKAPSAALRPAFASFSAWMTSIYKNLKNLNVTLDDNIRGVFDRLLATEEAIYAEKQRDAYKIPRDVRALANDAELAELGQLVREAELEAQQELQAAVADEISQFNRQEYKAAEAEATEQITKEVYSDPLYAAIELSRNGVTRDGTQLTDPDGKPSKMQMPRDEFVALFGVDAARAMPRGLLTKNVDTAIDVATFTMLSGFDSQDAMVAAMTTPHPRAAELIKQRVAERMGDEYSSLTDPGVAADRAAGIVANEKQVELAELQARILRRKTSEVLRGAAQRRALEEGAPSAVSDRERTEDIARASGAAPTAADAVPEQLSAAASEAQRQANIPQRKAQSAARRQVSQMMASFDIEGIKQAAKMFVGRAKVRDLTPQRYIAAADRLARKANKAIAGRDYAAAATLLEQKALNLAIAKEAGAAQTKVSRTVQRLRERSERSDKKLSKYRDLKIFNAARFILSSVGINRNPPPDLAGVLVEAQSALDEAPHKELEDTLNAVVSELAPYTQDGAADYRNLPYDVFIRVTHDAQSISKAAYDAHTLLVDGNRIAQQTVVNEMAAQTSDRVPVGRKKIGRGTPEQRKSIEKWGTLKAALTRVESWALAMDGGRYGGAFTTYLVKPVFDAISEYYAKRAEPLKALVEALRTLSGSLTSSGPIAAPELDGYVFQNKAELLHAILHTGNESNKKKLLKAGQVDINTEQVYQWSKENEDGTLDTSAWRSFMGRMFAENIITKAEMDLVQTIWNIFKETQGAAQKAHYRMHGFYFDTIEATPVETPFGTYPGGYVPAVTDKMMDIAGGARVDADNLASQQNASMFPNAEAGFTKSRVEAYAEPLELDLLRIPAHFDRVMKFSYLGPTVREVAKLVTSKRFRSMANRFDRNAVDQLLVPWLQRVVRQSVTTQDASRGWSRALSTLSNRMGMQTMAGNIVNAAQQLTGIPTAAAVVPSRLLMKHLFHYKEDGVGIRTFIAQHSAYMAVRFRNGVSDMLEEIETILTDTTPLAKTQAYAERYAYVAQQTTQNMVDPIVWMAAFDHAKELDIWGRAYTANASQGIDVAETKADAAAAYYADSVVRQTQSPMGAAEVSRVETGTPLWRMFIKFYGYFNSMLNFNVSRFDIIRREIGAKGKAGKFFYLYLMGIAIPAIVAEAISMGARGDFDVDDDEELAVVLAQVFLLSQIKFVAAAAPGGGAAINRVVGQFTAVPYDDRLSFSPVLSIFDSALSGGANLAEDAVTWAVEGEPARDASKLVKDGLNMVALLWGLPTNWFSKPVQYLLKTKEGNADPENVADYVQGFLTGRDGTEKKRN
jgi:GNAT superfamily N-acetyltransferase